MVQSADILQILVGLGAIYPTYALYRYYRKTKMLEFLFLMMTFMGIVLNQLFSILYRHGLVNEYPRVLANWFFLASNGIFFGLLVFDSLKNKMTIFVAVSTLTYFCLIILHIIFINNSILMYLYNDEASVSISSFPLIVQFFRLFVYTVGAIVFLTLEPSTKQEAQVSRQKSLMALSTVFVILYPLIVIPNLLLGKELSLLIPRLCNLIALIIWSYIALYHPEVLVFSLAPFVRATNLYSQLDKIDEVGLREFGTQRLVDYIKSIPIELFNQNE